MRVLVTGGAGYIGSILVAQLVENGYEVNVIDDLSTGHLSAIDSKATFTEGSVLNLENLNLAMSGCQAVFHLAAKTLVEESVKIPEIYMTNNFNGTQNVLNCMKAHKINKLIFSSTCSVYREQDIPLSESSELAPMNPYAASKLMSDELIKQFAEMGDIHAVILRFFNVAGSYKNQYRRWLVESHHPETHLIPKLLSILPGSTFHLYGSNWDTPDGSTIRDYVHVDDLAKACILALEKIEEIGFNIINIGSGQGRSTLEVVNLARTLLANELIIQMESKREGDGKALIADIEKAKTILGWTPKFDINQILQSSIDSREGENGV